MALQINSPIDGTPVGTADLTPLSDLPGVFERSKHAQSVWAALPWNQKKRSFIALRENILDSVDECVELLHRENGKPRMEAISHDLLPSVELLSYYLKHAQELLKPRSLSIGNPILFHRKSSIHHLPLGTVVVISPWNFPFLLPFGEIATALFAGNSVVFKPSEVTPLIGLKIQSLIDRSGFPSHLVQTVIGAGDLGAALIEHKPAKIFFTGSVETGKTIASAAAKHLIPVNLELGGKNPMVVLKDADVDYATSAALWGMACNGGQACSAVSRILVHRSIFLEFSKRLVEKLKSLRLGKDGEMSFITLPKQKSRYDVQIQQAVQSGATLLTGGVYLENSRQLEPTLWSGSQIETLSVYRDETFGPMASLVPFDSDDEAVQKANDTRYGLVASIFTTRPDKARELALRLEAGSVMINEVLYTVAIPETPWGGPKDSGSGVKHGEAGLLQFTQLRHLHEPRWRGSSYKSLWWFPYTPWQFKTFRAYLELYRGNPLRKLGSLPRLAYAFVKFLTSERRR